MTFEHNRPSFPFFLKATEVGSHLHLCCVWFSPPRLEVMCVLTRPPGIPSIRAADHPPKTIMTYAVQGRDSCVTVFSYHANEKTQLLSWPFGE